MQLLSLRSLLESVVQIKPSHLLHQLRIVCPLRGEDLVKAAALKVGATLLEGDSAVAVEPVAAPEVEPVMVA